MTQRHGPRVLAAVAFANLVFAALMFGLAAAAPTLRRAFGIDESQLGLVLGSPSLGLMFGTFLWGELADRVDERRVLTTAFAAFTVLLVIAAYLAAHDALGGFMVALFVAGAAGSAAHSAGGRAIAAAFAPERHGFVLALRHSAIPVGGAVGGVGVSWLAIHHGLGPAVGAIAACGAVAAIGVLVGLPSGSARASTDADDPVRMSASPLRSAPLWLLALGCACLGFVQLGVGSFLTIQLVDEAGVAAGTAAAIYAIAQLVGAGSRIVLGISSDRASSRVRVLQVVGWSALVVLVAASFVAGRAAGSALLVVAFVVTTSWNGVAVAAAAAYAPIGRTGATLGMLTTANAAAAALAPIVLGAVIDHAGWSAFAPVLAAVLVVNAVLLALLQRR
jgi:sugar phosphate permease